MSRRWLKDYRRNARVRKIKWSLSYPQFLKIISNVCHYCGALPVRQTRISRGKRRFSLERMHGIDRKNNTDGYTLENSVACCKQCNFAKYIFSEAEFIQHCERVLKYWRDK